ncbi:hypothetical protein EWM64_g4443 [Hericium alpestre]|uniref:DNA 3'-5' helicase n=1 Tax=Hericium alpestre TaxID=135208 RepID=A0A4Y9ZZI3_9AGAM|nr:hypothetical protein EWM64_g4443 [Hericium alpestre]
MKGLGLTAVAINANTLHKGRREGENLWESITEGVSMIMVSPEQLTGEDFQKLLDNKVFWARVIALGANEIHLLPAWGALFRKAYQQIGFMRTRFPDRIVAIGVTATMARGGALDTVRLMLGMQEDQFHCIRRSNFRPELQLLLRDLGTGINGHHFPALLWILKSRRKTVIYCATISLAFRVTSYLWTHAEDKTDLQTRLRMYTAINFPSYNSATHQILYEDPRPNITVATAAMAQGIDAPNIHDVVIVGEVTDPDEAHQRWGRAGRDRQKVSDPRGIMYLTGVAVRKAKAIVEGKGKTTNQNLLSSVKSSMPEMTEGMAQLILAKYLSAEQDRYYGNPRENPRCFCKTCSTSPPPTRSSTCNCGRCIPENLPPLPSMRTTKTSVGEPITASCHDQARNLLIALRYDIWHEADEYRYGSTPSAAFLPDITIAYLLANFTAFTSVDSLHPIVDTNPLLQPHED